MTRPIKITVLADSRGAIAGINKFSASVQDMGKRVIAGTAVAGAALAGVAAAAVKSAAEAQQSVGATQTVFGKFADRIIKESARAADSFGLTAHQYRQNANLIGASITGMGVPLNKATALTKDLVARGADLAATFGGSTEDAVGALGAAFRGEFDSLERYGLSLKQSEVSALLASRGQDKLKGAALKAATATATYDLVMQRSAKSQGQFARESNTFSGQMERLRAKIGNLRDQVGMALLPILTKALKFITGTALPAFKAWAAEMGDRLAPVFARIRDAVGTLMSKLEPLGDWLRKHPEVIKGVGIALGVAAVAAGAFAIAMGAVAIATSPITLVVLAIAALGGAIAYAWKNSETFRTAVTTVGDALRAKVLPAITELAQKIATNLQPVWAALVGFFQGSVLPALQQLVAKFKEWWPAIQRVIGVVASLVAKWAAFYTTVAGKVLPVVIRIAGFLVRNLVDAFLRNVSAVGTVIGKLVDFGRAVSNAGTKVGDFARKVATKIGNVVTWITELPGKVTAALGDVGSLLLDAGRQIIGGLFNGLKEKWEEVSGWVSSRAQWIKDHKGPPAKDKKLLVNAGKLIMQGLKDGLIAGQSDVERVLENTTKLIERAIKGKNHEKRVLKLLKGQFDQLRGVGQQLEDLQSGDFLQYLSTADSLYQKMTKAGVTNLEQARDLLERLKQDAADYAASIGDTIRATGNITQLGRQEDGTVSITSLLEQLKTKVTNAKRFDDLIRKFAAQGLSEEAINQMLAAGPEAALATAEAIEVGGADAIKHINDLSRLLSEQGDALGQSMAARYKQAGIDAAQGLINGLNQKLAEIQAAAAAIAAALTVTTKKKLKSKSPSKVFAGIGRDVVDGLAIGLDDTYVKRSAARMADALQTGFGQPALEAYAASGSGGQRVETRVRLSSEQVSRLQRGREVLADIDYAFGAGVQVSSNWK